MAPTAITRRTIARAGAVALVVGALASAPSAASTDAGRHVSPATAERLYVECIDGAPTSPDAHEHWVVECREHSAAGLG